MELAAPVVSVKYDILTPYDRAEGQYNSLLIYCQCRMAERCFLWSTEGQRIFKKKNVLDLPLIKNLSPQSTNLCEPLLSSRTYTANIIYKEGCARSPFCVKFWPAQHSSLWSTVGCLCLYPAKLLRRMCMICPLWKCTVGCTKLKISHFGRLLDKQDEIFPGRQ